MELEDRIKCDNCEEKDWRLKLELATLVVATLPHFHILQERSNP